MTYVLVENPEYAGRRPRALKPACHDGTPFLTFECLCGAPGHLHESQIPTFLNDWDVIELRCPSCRQPGELSVGKFRQAFREMREDGWYD